MFIPVCCPYYCWPMIADLTRRGQIDPGAVPVTRLTHSPVLLYYAILPRYCTFLVVLIAFRCVGPCMDWTAVLFSAPVVDRTLPFTFAKRCIDPASV